MENIQQLTEEMRAIGTYDDFLRVRRLLTQYGDAEVFGFLWPLSIQHPGAGFDVSAGYMLVELQPNSMRSIEALLADIHDSSLDASNRIIPFYLISEFGKHKVLEACIRFIGQLPANSPRSRVDAVQYWASMPASELCKRFHDWEARDMYGIADQ